MTSELLPILLNRQNFDASNWQDEWENVDLQELGYRNPLQARPGQRIVSNSRFCPGSFYPGSKAMQINPICMVIPQSDCNI